MKIFKTTIRNFARKPVINLINLVGLSISLTLVIILSVYVYSELSTDSYHTNGNRVYLYSDVNNLPRIYTPAILKDHIDLNIPEVESTVRLAGTWESPVFQAENREPLNSDLLFADQDFFKLFTFPVIAGDANTALKDPMSIVITQELSYKLFGTEQSIGKTVRVNNSQMLTVKAVLGKPKGNSCLSFNALASMDTRKALMPHEAEFKVWDMCIFQTFVLLKSGADPLVAAKRISTFFPKEMLKTQSAAALTPLKKLYFTNFSLFNGSYLHSGDQKKVMILLFVAALVLMIALVNFVNIFSAQWFENINNIGVLKIFGGSRISILKDMLSSSFLFFLGSLAIAFFLTNVFTPVIFNSTGIHFNIKLLNSPGVLIIALMSIFLLSIFFSIIPAWRISTSRITDNLKKTTENNHSGSVLRGVFVVAQFTIAIVLIAFTILVQKQVYFSSNLGISQDNIIAIKLTPELQEKREVLKKLLADNPAVSQTSFTQFFPGDMVSHWSTQVNSNGEQKPIEYDSFGADGSFPTIMGLKLLSGRFYTDNLPADANKALVNETFVSQNKLTNPVGLHFTAINGQVYEIVGVIKDFHYKSFNQPIAPLAITQEPYASYCLVNMKMSAYNTLFLHIDQIKKEVSALSSAFPVEVSFMDQAIENMYRSELQFRRVFFLFSGCAVIICCLGILAIALFAANQRTKEIGIRRVNGAGVFEVMLMLNRGFTQWVVMAFVIACPFAWYFMQKWLEEFAYKTPVSWWIFILSGIIALVVALWTVSFQSWRAATRNPVESLRYE